MPGECKVPAVDASELGKARPRAYCQSGEYREHKRWGPITRAVNCIQRFMIRQRSARNRDQGSHGYEISCCVPAKLSGHFTAFRRLRK